MKYILLIITIFIFTACDKDISSSSDDQKAYLISASAVKGIKYTCSKNDTILGYTKENGKFTYPTNCGDIIFKIGSIELSRLNIQNIPIDDKLYITNLVGSNTDDTSHIGVSNITRILQSLDSNYDINDGIDISNTISTNIEKKFITSSISIKDIHSEEDLKTILFYAGVDEDKLVSSNYALVLFEQKLREDGYTHVDTQNPFTPYLDNEYFKINSGKILIKYENQITTIATADNLDTTLIKLFAESNTNLFINNIDKDIVIPNINMGYSYIDKLSLNTQQNRGEFVEYNITTKDSTNKSSDILKLRILKDGYSPSFDINNIYDYNVSVSNEYILDINVSDIDVNTTNKDANGLVVYDITSANKDLFDISSNGILSFKNTAEIGNYIINITITDFAKHQTNQDFNITIY